MSSISEQIEAYDAARDEAGVFALWQVTVGQQWPLNLARLQKVLTGPEPEHFVVREDGQVVGFVATFKSHRDAGKTGHLAALLVAPQWQGRGIGTALHETALEHLSGVRSVQLGSIVPRFWCGVPGNLPGAASFFQARGWKFGDTVYDIVQDLSSYATPEKIRQRMQQERISFEVATSQNITDVLAFEAREFPNWLMHIERCANKSDHRDLLVARDDSERVVGTLVMYSPQSHPSRADVIWQGLLGEDAGAIGAVGVAASERGRGIGIALVAYGSELLKERGVRNCYIDWVVLTDFYAKLGYEKWRDYQTSWRTL